MRPRHRETSICCSPGWDPGRSPMWQQRWLVGPVQPTKGVRQWGVWGVWGFAGWERSPCALFTFRVKAVGTALNHTVRGREKDTQVGRDPTGSAHRPAPCSQAARCPQKPNLPSETRAREKAPTAEGQPLPPERGGPQPPWTGDSRCRHRGSPPNSQLRWGPQTTGTWTDPLSSTFQRRVPDTLRI